MDRINQAEFVGQFAPGSPAWLAARQHGLGGSEIAPVLGLSPFESRFSLWHRKVGLANPVPENDVMHWGTLLEATIREEFNRRHVLDDGFMAYEAGTWRHSERQYQIANPDGLIWPLVLDDEDQPPDALLEVKNARTDDGWGEEGTDEIPVYYRTQILWYLDVFGLDLAHVAVLIGGSEYREYQLEASPDEAEFMRGKAVEFLGTVERRERPSIDEHDQTYQVIREMHPDIEDATVEVPGDIAAPYLSAAEGHRQATDEKRRTTAILADYMGSARRATFAGEQIAMRVTGNPPYVKVTPHKASGQKVSAA